MQPDAGVGQAQEHSSSGSRRGMGHCWETDGDLSVNPGGTWTQPKLSHRGRRAACDCSTSALLLLSKLVKTVLDDFAECGCFKTLAKRSIHFLFDFLFTRLLLCSHCTITSSIATLLLETADFTSVTPNEPRLGCWAVQLIQDSLVQGFIISTRR